MKFCLCDENALFRPAYNVSSQNSDYYVFQHVGVYWRINYEVTEEHRLDCSDVDGVSVSGACLLHKSGNVLRVNDDASVCLSALLVYS